MRRRGSIGLVAAIALSAMMSTGSTYAAFSDVADVTGNQVAAGTVVIGGGASATPQLRYIDLVPGVPVTNGLSVRYAGTVAADLYLEIGADPSSAYCAQGPGGAWIPRAGGAVQIKVADAAWADYCSLLGVDRGIVLASDVAGGDETIVDVQVRLQPGTDFRHSSLTDTDPLTLVAVQSNGGSFSDYVTGTIEIGTATIVPATPAECLAAGLGPFDADHTFILTEGDDVFSTPRQPLQGKGYLVLGLGGHDRIIGSNHADCLSGGAGDDHLWGGNQDDVLIGGEGDDTLVGHGVEADEIDTHTANGNGKDRLYGGPGDDVLFGGNGKDELYGEDGDDHLDGGRASDVVNGGAGHDVCLGSQRQPFVDCEQLVVEPLAPTSIAATSSEPPAGSLDAAPPTEVVELPVAEPMQRADGSSQGAADVGGASQPPSSTEPPVATEPPSAVVVPAP